MIATQEKLTIDTEFKRIIPALTPEEFDGLERDIIENGCRVPLDVWDDVLVDGHNRYEICTKHGIEYQVNPIEFEIDPESYAIAKKRLLEAGL